MVDLVFNKGTELVAIRILQDDIFFSQLKGNYVTYSGIEGLKFSVSGILKEFPDLKDKEVGEMRRIAIERFKEKFKSFPTEKERIRYLQEDLKEQGYILTMIKKVGFRPIKLKDGIDRNAY